jgi:hypothetical protein
VDDYTEYELWLPYQGDAMELSKISAKEYPPMRMHANSCFQNSCKLAVIINDIILRLYSRHTAQHPEQTLRDVDLRLEEYRTNTPSHLLVDPLDLPNICPPIHILAQKLVHDPSR